MRIGIDARPLTVPMFGIGRYTLCLLKELTKIEGITWYLYADRPIIYPILGDNIVIREYPSHKRWLSLYRTQVPFARWAKKDKLDVFWSPRHHLPLMLDKSIRSVLTIHDLVWQKYPETMLRENLLVEKLLMPRSLIKADAVIAVSESTKNDLVESYPLIKNKLSVIYEAIERVEVSEVRLLDKPYFLCVGTQEPRKNLRTSLAAFHQYRAAGGNRHLVVIGGKGWNLDNPQQGLKQHQEFIHILGRVSDEDLMTYYRFAEAFVFPSLYEGFGLPPLEAMQFSVPVISSNRSSLPEVVGEGGILVDPMSIDQICDAMIKISRDQAFRNNLGEKAFEQSKKFSWLKAAKETLDVFKSQLC